MHSINGIVFEVILMLHCDSMEEFKILILTKVILSGGMLIVAIVPFTLNVPSLLENIF